jgi:thiamine kinase-like enzyme
VWAHPDLSPANVLIFGHEITVIDWSGATARLPLFDFLYFVMLWAKDRNKEQGLDARLHRFREIFIARREADAVTTGVRAGIRRYLKRLEIDSRFVPILLTLAWVARQLDCHDRERQVERGDPDANPHPGESYVEYLEILAEEVEMLFSEPSRAWWSE